MQTIIHLKIIPSTIKKRIFYSFPLHYNKNLLNNKLIYRFIHHFDAPRLDDLVLIRHGESEGNVARRRSIQGDHSLYMGEFKNRHSSSWRLTDKGREQAAAAGEWLKENNFLSFDRYYVSEYLRAMETASRLNINNAEWYAEMLIRERDWGQMDLMSEEERVSLMYDELKRRDLNRFYYAPPGGESLAAVAQRADRLLAVMHRECHNKKVIVVCHGEVMWAFRTRVERMSQDTFEELQESGRMIDQIHNGHILHYTRTNPYNGERKPFFTYMRSVCPWNTKLAPKGWIKIERPVYDNQMLLAIAERKPRMIVSDEYVNQTYQAYSNSNSLDSSVTMISHKKAESVERMNKKKKSLENQQYKNNKENTKINEPKIQLKNVLIVNKKTRFQHECQLYGNTGEDLKKQISMRGFVYDRLKASNDHHLEAVDEIVNTLRSYNINCTVIDSDELTKNDVKNKELFEKNNFDCIFSAGGDGTFLKAASFVNKANLPVAGINTDPSRSEGNLCCCSINFDECSTKNKKNDRPLFFSQSKNNSNCVHTTTNGGGFSQILDNILNGNFQWLYRKRIRVGLVNQEGYKHELCRYALNEVFIAENDPSRPSFYDIGIDQKQREMQRSSGIIICTGTGSTAWHYSASQIHREEVSRVLLALDHKHTNEKVTEITEILNKQFIFEEDSNDVSYIVREPIINSTFGEIRHRRGRARRVSMRSLGWDIRLNIDGIYSIPLDYGVQAVMKIGTEPNYTLQTFQFHNVNTINENEKIKQKTKNN